MPGSRALRRSLRWLRSRFRPRALVLGYHRVADEPHDPFGLCVSPARFEQQLEVLARRARPLPLGELLRAARHGQLPRRGVAVTFDDGYADLLAVADPLLRRHEVPATCFVVTGALGRELWWDALARFVRAGVRRGHPLRLSLPGGEIRWDPAERSSSPARRSSGQASPLPRLYARLRALDGDRRQGALSTLEEWAGGAAVPDPTARVLTGDELTRLVGNGIWGAGAHTHSHPDLLALEPAARRVEIDRSGACLEELLGRPVEGFAYPFGSTAPSVAEEVRGAGFRWACASGNDVVRGGTDPYRVPRFWPGNWDGAHFERWLRWWL